MTSPRVVFVVTLAGPRGCDLGNDRQTGKSPEHVPDARYGRDAEQRHIADIWGEAAEATHRRDRLHADAGPPYLADHGRSEQVSPAEGGAVSQWFRELESERPCIVSCRVPVVQTAGEFDHEPTDITVLQGDSDVGWGWYEVVDRDWSAKGLYVAVSRHRQPTRGVHARYGRGRQDSRQREARYRGLF